MGIDVNLYAVGDVTDGELAEAEKFVRARVAMDDFSEFRRSPYDPRRIELSDGSRYYGPGYERGPWPHIYGMIRVMQAALPQCKIHYGGDSHDEALEVTDDELAEIWAHYLGPHGDDYHESSRAFNARLKGSSPA